MRSTLLADSVFTLYLCHTSPYIFSAALHNLYRIADTELVLLCKPYFSVDRHFFNYTKKHAFYNIRTVIIYLHVFVWLAKIKSGCKLPVCALSDLFFIPFKILGIPFGRCCIVIDGMSVRSCYRRNVKCRLHAAFYLEAVDTRINKLRNMLYHAQIF